MSIGKTVINIQAFGKNAPLGLIQLSPKVVLGFQQNLVRAPMFWGVDGGFSADPNNAKEGRGKQNEE